MILFTLLTGIIYPLLSLVLAQVFFPWQANGSLIEQNGKIDWFSINWTIISLIPIIFGDALLLQPLFLIMENSSGSNIGPSNPDFLATVKDRVTQLYKQSESTIIIS